MEAGQHFLHNHFAYHLISRLVFAFSKIPDVGKNMDFPNFKDFWIISDLFAPEFSKLKSLKLKKKNIGAKKAGENDNGLYVTSTS